MWVSTECVQTFESRQNPVIHKSKSSQYLPGALITSYLVSQLPRLHTALHSLKPVHSSPRSQSLSPLYWTQRYDSTVFKHQDVAEYNKSQSASIVHMSFLSRGSSSVKWKPHQSPCLLPGQQPRHHLDPKVSLSNHRGTPTYRQPRRLHPAEPPRSYDCQMVLLGR